MWGCFVFTMFLYFCFYKRISEKDKEGDDINDFEAKLRQICKSMFFLPA